jgi:hypothetical protein
MMLESGASTKLVILLGDAPAHGSKFHNGAEDRYPEGDPNGRDPCDYMEKFGKNKVHFHLVQMSRGTEKVC